MNNRITYIGLYAFSLYSLIMSLICGIIVLLLVMLCATLFLYCLELNYFTSLPKSLIAGEAWLASFFAFKAAEGYKLTSDEVLFLKENRHLVNLIPLTMTVETIFRYILFCIYMLDVYYPMWQLMLFLQNKKKKVMYTSNTLLEICWTILPIGILVVIMLPSLVLLYAMDDVSIAFGNVTMKVIGHQWYWSYQHVNMSPELMPVFHDINKLAYIKKDWLSVIDRL